MGDLKQRDDEILALRERVRSLEGEVIILRARDKVHVSNQNKLKDERLHIAIEALQKIRMRTRLIAGSGAVAGAALEKIKDLGVGGE